MTIRPTDTSRVPSAVERKHRSSISNYNHGLAREELLWIGLQTFSLGSVAGTAAVLLGTTVSMALNFGLAGAIIGGAFGTRKALKNMVHRLNRLAEK